MKAAASGFTLLEVLIALAIVAIGLGAAVRATGQVVSGTEQMKLRTLALWVAENRAAAHAAGMREAAPEGFALQAGLRFVWRETVSPLPDGASRVEISVAAAAQPEQPLAQLAAFAPPPAKP